MRAPRANRALPVIVIAGRVHGVAGQAQDVPRAAATLPRAANQLATLAAPVAAVVIPAVRLLILLILVRFREARLCVSVRLLGAPLPLLLRRGAGASGTGGALLRILGPRRAFCKKVRGGLPLWQRRGRRAARGAAWKCPLEKTCTAPESPNPHPQPPCWRPSVAVLASPPRCGRGGAANTLRLAGDHGLDAVPKFCLLHLTPPPFVQHRL